MSCKVCCMLFENIKVEQTSIWIDDLQSFSINYVSQYASKLYLKRLYQFKNKYSPPNSINNQHDWQNWTNFTQPLNPPHLLLVLYFSSLFNVRLTHPQSQ